jgi:hypothetical protein
VHAVLEQTEVRTVVLTERHHLPVEDQPVRSQRRRQVGQLGEPDRGVEPPGGVQAQRLIGIPHGGDQPLAVPLHLGRPGITRRWQLTGHRFHRGDHGQHALESAPAHPAL